MNGKLRAGVMTLFLPIALAAAGCSRSGDDATVRLALQTEPTTLDPAYSVDFSSGRIASLVHSNLVAVDPDARVIPDLARSWEILDGGRRYVFHLGGARFSSGRSVTASDVVYSVRRLLDPETGSPAGGCSSR